MKSKRSPVPRPVTADPNPGRPSASGPELELLLRRLAECPPVFLGEPAAAAEAGKVVTAALVQDLVLDLGGKMLSMVMLKPFMPSGRKSAESIRSLKMVQIACWLLSHEGFLGLLLPDQVWSLLADGFAQLAALVPPETIIRDPDRREEFVRICLRGLDLRPAGETPAQASDRLQTLDSVERVRLIKEARAAEERARKIREEMARKAAAEAAANYGRE